MPGGPGTAARPGWHQTASLAKGDRVFLHSAHIKIAAPCWGEQGGTVMANPFVHVELATTDLDKSKIVLPVAVQLATARDGYGRRHELQDDQAVLSQAAPNFILARCTSL